MFCSAIFRSAQTEVQAFYESSISPDNELDDDLKLAIEAKIRKQRYIELKNSMRERLRAGTEITIDEKVLSPRYDDQRSRNGRRCDYRGQANQLE